MKDGSKSADRDERGLLRVIRFSSAAGLGLMAALLYSVKQVTPGFRFEVSLGSIVAFLIGAAFSSVLWRVVFRTDETGQWARKRRVWFAALGILLSLATATAFVFSLRGLANEKLREIVQGTFLAVFALSGVGFLLWRTARFLERDSRRGNDGTPKTEPESRS